MPDRREFLGAVAGVAAYAGFGPPLDGDRYATYIDTSTPELLPDQHEVGDEVIDVKWWCSYAPEGAALGCAEIHCRVNGGEYHTFIGAYYPEEKRIHFPCVGGCDLWLHLNA